MANENTDENPAEREHADIEALRDLLDELDAILSKFRDIDELSYLEPEQLHEECNKLSRFLASAKARSLGTISSAQRAYADSIKTHIKIPFSVQIRRLFMPARSLITQQLAVDRVVEHADKHSLFFLRDITQQLFSIYEKAIVTGKGAYIDFELISDAAIHLSRVHEYTVYTIRELQNIHANK